MPQHITVVNYDPEWPSKYVRERDYITEILKEKCISIYILEVHLFRDWPPSQLSILWQSLEVLKR